MYEDEFENIYSRILHNRRVINLENTLVNFTLSYPFEVSEILNEFLPFMNYPVLNKWINLLQEYKYEQSKRKTNKERKQTRVVIRHIYRISEQNVKLNRMLELIIHIIYVELSKD
jgi:hypothetical protein